MKKKMFFALIGLLVIVSGCYTTKVVPTDNKQVQTGEPVHPKSTYIVWKENLIPGFNLNVGDPINFLNSSEIILSGDVFSQQIALKDGKIVIGELSRPVSKNVPEATLGVLVSVVRVAGRIKEMNMIFSQSDASFKFNFRIKPDGSYTLNGNASLEFDGKEYPIKAASQGRECLLVVDSDVTRTVEPINGTAEGVPVSGTKIIK